MLQSKQILRVQFPIKGEILSYLELLQRKEYPRTHSKDESLKILQKYQSELTHKEYKAILDSLCSHAIEGMFFSEENILLAISSLKNELSMPEIVEIVKAS
jgi:hypothetical protein